jgi:hypothetical protein
MWPFCGLKLASPALQRHIPISLSIYQEQRFILGRPRHRWENNIKMDLQEMWWGGMDCIAVALGFIK